MPTPATTPRPLIELRDVVRLYQLGDTAVRALDGKSLTIACGELLASIGASGSWKSTLTNVGGCRHQPTSGQYLFEGVDLAQLSEPALAHIRSQPYARVREAIAALRLQGRHLARRSSAHEEHEHRQASG
jgi:ABC-type lipoprotein export system ATPase subunit